jgi:hypothetical protein
MMTYLSLSLSDDDTPHRCFRHSLPIFKSWLLIVCVYAVCRTRLVISQKEKEITKCQKVCILNADRPSSVKL